MRGPWRLCRPWTNGSDSDLTEDLARGEAEVLGEIYARYGRMIYSVILRHAPGLGRAELEDLTQDALLTFYDTAPRYREQGKTRACFARTLRRAKSCSL